LEKVTRICSSYCKACVQNVRWFFLEPGANGFVDPFFRAFSSLAASPEYRDRFLGEEPVWLTPKQARCFRGSLLRSVLRAARRALNSRSVVGSYVMGSASLPIEALILAHWPALSGMVSGGLTSCWRAPKMRFRGWLDGLGAESESSWAGYSTHSREFVSCHGVFLGSGCVGQKIRPAYFSGKTRGRKTGHGEQVGRHVLQVLSTWAASRFIPRAVSGGRTAWGETGELWGGRQRPQPIVYCLSRKFLGL